MSANLELERQLKLVAKTGSYIVGRREVSTSLKGAKLLVWSASANVPQSILDECKSLSVPAIKFGGNPVELGHACGIPFRVSVIALKSAGDADLSNFTKSTDYHSGVVVPAPKLMQQQSRPSQQQSQKLAKESAEPKSKKESKRKDTEKSGTKKAKKTDESEENKKSTKKKSEEPEKPKKDTDETKQKKSAAKKKKKSEEDEEE
jgi:large subunit ribosomal protein L30e